MAGTFDAYYTWLAIPPAEQPPDHYRLLGIAPLESNVDVITEAAERQARYVAAQGKGAYKLVAEKLLDEIRAARGVLLDEGRKGAYDAQLGAQLAPESPVPAAAAAPAVAPPPPMSVATPAEGGSGLLPSEGVVVETRQGAQRPRGEGRKQIRWSFVAIGAAAAALVVAFSFIGRPGPEKVEGDRELIPPPPGAVPPPPPVPAPEGPPPPVPPAAPGSGASDPSTVPADGTPGTASGTTPGGTPATDVPDGEEGERVPFEGRNLLADGSLAGIARELVHATAEGDVALAPLLGVGESSISLSPPGGLLVGLELIVSREGELDATVDLVGDIYLLPSGELFTRRHAGVRRDPGVEPKRVIARPGYAVGALRSAGGVPLRGVQIVFTAVVSIGLYPRNSYTSEWYGGGENEFYSETGGDFRPVVGVGRHFAASSQTVRDVSVVQAKLPSIEQRLRSREPQPPSVTVQSLRDLSEFVVALREATQDGLRKASLTDRVGAASQLPRQLMRRRPRGALPRIVSKIDLALQGQRGKTVVRGVRVHFATPGTQSPSDFTLIGSFNQGVPVEIVPADGFCIGGLEVQGSGHVDGLRALFVQMTPQGPKSSIGYFGRWHGAPRRDAHRLGGSGRPVVGLAVGFDDYVRSLGLIEVDLGGGQIAAIGGAAQNPPNGAGARNPVLPGVNPPMRAPVKQQPVPAGGDRAEAEKEIVQLFGDQIERARRDSEKIELAKELFNTARETNDSAAAQFVLLEKSFELVNATSQFGHAWDILDEIALRFETDVLARKEDALIRGERKAKSTDHHSVVAGRWKELLEAAVDADDYKLAIRCASRGAQSARRAKLREMVIEFDSRKGSLAKIADAHSDAIAAKKKLEADPDDAASAAAWGEFCCVYKQEWETGLPLLAKGSDAELAEAARADLAEPSEAAAQVKLAERWWKAAEEAGDEFAARGLRGRAIHWYRRALPSLSGLTKKKVAARLDGVGGEAVDTDGWISLLERVDTKRHAVSGIWLVNSRGAATQRGGVTGTLPNGLRGTLPKAQTLGLPVVASGSYELEVEFTYASGSEMSILFPVGGRPFSVVIRPTKPKALEYYKVSGTGGSLPQASNNVSTQVQPGAVYRVTIRVDHVEAGKAQFQVDWNGSRALAWSGNPGYISRSSVWDADKTDQIYVATYQAAGLFKSVRIRPLEGGQVNPL